jgi:hypothetical protein
MDVMINETEINVPADISTWGDLLDWIETDFLKTGQCITHVYMAGSEAYNYRDQRVCGQDLSSVGNVAIHSGDFDKVVNESLAELDTELRAALAGCEDVVRLLENRKEPEAYERLAQLLDSIRLFFAIFSEDLGWTDPLDEENPRRELSAVLARALKQLISAQENRYSVSVCDVLEYEITPILETWQKLVARTRDHSN